MTYAQTEQTQEQAGGRAPARAWWALAILALPCLLYSMDLTILNLAVPHMAAALQPSGTQLLWIVDIYGFVLAGMLVTMGSLGDRIGRRRLLLWGAFAFGAASTLAAFAPTAEMLILARALLGLAAATLAPSTLSLISNIFANERERGLAIGIWVASFSVGGAIGPIVGGLLLEQFWWGSVFLVAVPVMVLLLALGPVLLPEFRDPGAGRIDLVSAGMSLVAILSLVYGVKHLAIGEFGTLPAALLGLGLVVGLLFVLRQLRLPDPMIDIRLFGRAALLMPLAIYFLGLFLAFGVLLLLAQYLQLVLGLSPRAAGLWTLFSAAGFVAGSLLAPGLAARSSARLVMVASLSLALAGFALTGAGVWLSSFPALLGGMVLFSLGISPILALSTDLIVGAAPVERSGSAAALAETASELGGALGIAVAGSLAIGWYRDRLSGLLPAELPAALQPALLDNPVSAMEAVGQLSAPLHEAAAGAVQLAFSQAIVQHSLVAVGIGAVALLIATRLRPPAQG